MRWIRFEANARANDPPEETRLADAGFANPRGLTTHTGLQENTEKQQQQHHHHHHQQQQLQQKVQVRIGFREYGGSGRSHLPAKRVSHEAEQELGKIRIDRITCAGLESCATPSRERAVVFGIGIGSIGCTGDASCLRAVIGSSAPSPVLFVRVVPGGRGPPLHRVPVVRRVRLREGDTVRRLHREQRPRPEPARGAEAA